MDTKFIRAFVYGLEADEKATVNVDGKDVGFSNETPQVDIPIGEQPADAEDHQQN